MNYSTRDYTYIYIYTREHKPYEIMTLGVQMSIDFVRTHFATQTWMASPFHTPWMLLVERFCDCLCMLLCYNIMIPMLPPFVPPSSDASSAVRRTSSLRRSAPFAATPRWNLDLRWRHGRRVDGRGGASLGELRGVPA